MRYASVNGGAAYKRPPNMYGQTAITSPRFDSSQPKVAAATDGQRWQPAPMRWEPAHAPRNALGAGARPEQAHAPSTNIPSTRPLSHQPKWSTAYPPPGAAVANGNKRPSLTDIQKQSSKRPVSSTDLQEYGSKRPFPLTDVQEHSSKRPHLEGGELVADLRQDPVRSHPTPAHKGSPWKALVKECHHTCKAIKFTPLRNMLTTCSKDPCCPIKWVLWMKSQCTSASKRYLDVVQEERDILEVLAKHGDVPVTTEWLQKHKLLMVSQVLALKLHTTNWPPTLYHQNTRLFALLQRNLCDLITQACSAMVCRPINAETVMMWFIQVFGELRIICADVLKAAMTEKELVLLGTCLAHTSVRLMEFTVRNGMGRLWGVNLSLSRNFTLLQTLCCNVKCNVPAILESGTRCHQSDHWKAIFGDWFCGSWVPKLVQGKTKESAIYNGYAIAVSNLVFVLLENKVARRNHELPSQLVNSSIALLNFLKDMISKPEVDAPGATWQQVNRKLAESHFSMRRSFGARHAPVLKNPALF